ncbi:MAG: S8 family serine peptidase [Chloroflexi bacterium]|nr:S8 family serine peptidase [Chloroflexota bacterium]
MGMAPQKPERTISRRSASPVRRAVFFVLALAFAVAIVGTPGVAGPLGNSARVATADSGSGQQVSTHVVVKLKPGAAIEWLLAKVSTWRYSSGGSEGYYRAVLEKSFPGTAIYVLRVTSGDAGSLAGRLPAQKAQVAWAEAGIFTPLAESNRFSPAAYERFNQAAFERFNQAAYERFSQVAYERFNQAAFERFSQAAYEKFSQAAYEKFAQAVFERFSQAAYERFAQATYEQFTQAAAEKFTQAAYDSFTAAAYEQFRQASYEKFSQAAYEQFRQAAVELFAQAAFERFSQATFEKFSQAAYERFSQAIYEEFSQAVFERFTQAAYEQLSLAVLDRFSQAVFERFSQAAFEAFTQAVFERFSQAVYEELDQAELDRFSQAVYEEFSASVYERFSQTIYEEFSQAVRDSLAGAIVSVVDDPEFRLAFQQLLAEMFAAYQQEFGARIEGQPALAQIRAKEARAVARGDGITVAVIDTGVYLNHWYLAGALAADGIDLIDGGAPNDVGDGIDNNGNGYSDEGVGHGTFIAGLVHLVAPGARILPVRAMDDEGAGWSFIVAEGIYRAVDAGADVINLSLSVPERSMVLQEALDYAERQGVVVVAAVGNDGEKLSLYPAADRSVTGVAAVDALNRKAEFSNYGNSSVSVAAPGVDLYGPYPAGAGFAWWSGTSFSTGLVAGEAALVYQLNAGGNDPDGRVRSIIDDTARSLGASDPVYGVQLGKGLIDVLAAVQYRSHRK